MNGKSTTDAIFALRQLQERYREGQQDLHCVFIDLEKAYDIVSREELYWCMRDKRVPELYWCMRDKRVPELYWCTIERQEGARTVLVHERQEGAREVYQTGGRHVSTINAKL